MVEAMRMTIGKCDKYKEYDTSEMYSEKFANHGQRNLGKV